jgi:hypothetical protein
MIATDGVYFTSPHTSLALSDTELGKWGESKKENMTLFMPGVYWDDKTRERVASGGVPKLKSRGISARDLAKSISSLDGSFTDFATGITNGQLAAWPVFDITTSFEIVSCSQALQRHDWPSAGRVTKGKPRTISADPFRKRASAGDAVYIDGSIVRTMPHGSDRPLESVSYTKLFGQELQERLFMTESVTADGDNGDLLAWLLSGVENG